uniref:Importin subunit alpha n=1 Tax=Elaeis guineensis var. tenera TaxID=51953 RepID=A0A8N4F362_ELAGV|nr:importin subunit alpha-2 isoform X2 [Elaeis guineensis]
MADEGVSPPSQRRDSIKSSVHNTAAQRRRQHAIAVGKERREALIRTKRLCRVAVVDDSEVLLEGDMLVDEEKAVLDSQTSQTVEDLKSALSYHGKGATQKKIEILRALRRLLSKSEVPPVEAALQAGAIPVLVQCLSFGSADEQLLEAAWCLTNIAAGEPEETRSLLPALPLLIAHLGEKSSVSVAEQCAWALGNVAGEGEELRNVLLSQGALLPLARLMLSNKASTTRTAAWALSNLIKVLRSLGNLVAGDSYITDAVLIVGHDITDQVLSGLVKCLKSEHRVLKKEAAWVLSNIAAGSFEHKELIFSSEASPLLMHLLLSAPFDIRKEVAYVLGNLCVAPAKGAGQPSIILRHLVTLVNHGCLPGFINLVRSADIESAKLGLQFLELVLRGMPNGEGPKLVEREDGIDAMERFQFHENEEMRNMANGLVDKYFGEDYGVDE